LPYFEAGGHIRPTRSRAISRQGLDVSEYTMSGKVYALLPHDGSFTALVMESDDAARDAFDQYEGCTDPETFETLAGNVIVLADASNAPTPLPHQTRRRIMRALRELSADS
jgi:hypothetical protein